MMRSSSHCENMQGFGKQWNRQVVHDSVADMAVSSCKLLYILGVYILKSRSAPPWWVMRVALKIGGRARPLWYKTCSTAAEEELCRRENMMRRTRAFSVGICLILVALVAGCAGDRMSRSTEEAVDDSLLANKVKLTLYADKQVSGRQIAVEASQGVIQLSGVVGSLPEAQRAVQLAEGIKGVKEVRNRLTVK
jgi:hypothetical protein